jgi:hypothetical protein
VTSIAPVGTGFSSFPVTGVSNSTDDGSELVPSVIYTTQIFTSTGCAQTVTDCPASSTILVTSTIPLTTTVCPKSELPTPTPEATTSAAPNAPSVPGNGYGTGDKTSAVVEAVSTPVTEKVHVSTETLVYTIGTGSSAHAVTTEVATTSTETIYKTIYITKSYETASPSKEGVESEAAPTGGKDEATTYTTLESTSTTTQFITVHPSASAPAANVPGNGYGTGEDVPVEGAGSVVPPGGGAGGAGECAPATTVTVTEQETVTVTAGQSTPTAEVPAEEENVSSAYVPAESTPASDSAPVPTDVPAPYPVGNGTLPSGTGASSGFLTQTRPVGGSPSVPSGGFSYPAPSGTGVPVAPTSELPTFVLPTESSAAVESTAAPVGEESSAVVATPAPSAPAVDYGNGYQTGGNYKRFFGLF